MLAAVAYLEALGTRLADEEEGNAAASRRESIVRAMTAIRCYEATLSAEMLRVLKAAGATVYGIDDPARLNERVPTLCFNLLKIAPAHVTEVMSDRGIGIRDGHMYTPRLMKHLDLPLESGVLRASLLHYNTVEEIQEFGKVLIDIAGRS